MPPFLEYGESSGLAYKKDWNAQMDRETQLYHMQHQYKREAMIDAENKAKLFSDIQYGSSMNPRDAGEIDKFTQQHTSEFGQWLNENPNFNLDPVKMLQFQNYKKNYLDNPAVQKGMRHDAYKKELDTYATKHPDATDELMPFYQQYNDYINGKSDDFIFTAPEENFDSQKYLSTMAGKVHQTGYQPYGDNIDGYRQFITDSDKHEFANAILSSSEGKHFTRTWKDMPEQQKSQFKDINDWVLKSSEMWMPSDKIEIGKTPGRYSGKGAGAGTGSELKPYDDILQQASKNPGIPLQASSRGAYEMMTDHDGNYVLDNAEVIGNKGNRTPVNLGLTKTASTADSKIVFFPSGTDPNNGKYYMSVKVRMTPKEFESRIPNAQGAIDKPTFGMESVFGPTDFHSSFSGKNDYKVVKDEKGDDVIEFTAWKPVSNNSSLGLSYNGGAGAKAQGADATPSTAYDYEDDNYYYKKVQGGFERTAKK